MRNTNLVVMRLTIQSSSFSSKLMMRILSIKYALALFYSTTNDSIKFLNYNTKGRDVARGTYELNVSVTRLSDINSSADYPSVGHFLFGDKKYRCTRS